MKGAFIMSKTYCYMRISTKEERGKQKFDRQEKALQRYAEENNIEYFRVFKDDASAKTFDRKDWKVLEKNVDAGDTIIFKDITRFTREAENGYKKYMSLMNKGVNLIFLDNSTISTPYIKDMLKVAEQQSNRIAKMTLENTIELLIMVELDRAETERINIAKRIKQGIEASDKASGRKTGQVDKLTDELRADINEYLKDRKITKQNLIDKHHISRNTLCKYIKIVEDESKG